MEIIEAVSLAVEPLSPADLSFQLSIPKASLHRLLHQLENSGYLQANMRVQPLLILKHLKHLLSQQESMKWVLITNNI